MFVRNATSVLLSGTMIVLGLLKLFDSPLPGSLLAEPSVFAAIGMTQVALGIAVMSPRTRAIGCVGIMGFGITAIGIALLPHRSCGCTGATILLSRRAEAAIASLVAAAACWILASRVRPTPVNSAPAPEACAN